MPSELELIELRDTDQTVRDPEQDIRGRKVVGRDGKELGRIDALLVSSGDHAVRMLRVEHGGLLGFGSASSYLPVEAITSIDADVVRVDLDRDRVDAAPQYDPEIVDRDQLYDSIYSYYGYPSLFGMPVVPLPVPPPAEKPAD